MQAYAEGFEIMEAKKEFGLDLGQIAQGWRYGSVVRSWLLDLATTALKEDPKLDSLEAYVDDSGEGRWTVQESIDLAVPAAGHYPVVAAALSLPPGRALWGQNACCPAQPVRRPRGKAGSERSRGEY